MAVYLQMFKFLCMALCQSVYTLLSASPLVCNQYSIGDHMSGFIGMQNKFGSILQSDSIINMLFCTH
jgi:hypothetical protein